MEIIINKNRLLTNTIYRNIVTIGKVVIWAKLAVPSHSEPLRWYHLVVW